MITDEHKDIQAPQYDPFMFNYAWQGTDGSNMAQALENGIYSRHKAKFIAWHRHYNRFWKESIGYCYWMWANFTSDNKPVTAGLRLKLSLNF